MDNLTKDNFKETITTGVQIVDFWAVWCGPCKMQTPILENLAEEYAGTEVQIYKVNVDDEPELSAQFGIQSIPTLLFFKNGNLVDRLIGVRMIEELRETVEELR